jgi:hypothetical protein
MVKIVYAREAAEAEHARNEVDVVDFTHEDPEEVGTHDGALV